MPAGIGVITLLEVYIHYMRVLYDKLPCWQSATSVLEKIGKRVVVFGLHQYPGLSSRVVHNMFLVSSALSCPLTTIQMFAYKCLPSVFSNQRNEHNLQVMAQR